MCHFGWTSRHLLLHGAKWIGVAWAMVIGGK
jgi:hypothetical protein